MLHGLPSEDPDPFIDLRPIEQRLRTFGFASREFQWPPSFNPLRALASRHRSFSGELAGELDSYLRREVAGIYPDGQWLVVAHSGGGTVFYRWLLDYLTTFNAQYSTLPGLALVFAAPYQCQLQRIHLPTCQNLPVREPVLDPAHISARLPGKTVVFASPDDDTALPHDTLFPSDVILTKAASQYLINGATHRDICDPRHHRLCGLLVDYYVGLLP